MFSRTDNMGFVVSGVVSGVFSSRSALVCERSCSAVTVAGASAAAVATCLPYGVARGRGCGHGRARVVSASTLKMAKEEQDAAREKVDVTSDEEEDDEEVEVVDASEVSDMSEEEAGDGVDALLNSPEFLRKKLEVLQKELAEERANMEQMDAALKKEKESYLRLAADFENFRRRTATDLTDSGTRATVKVLKQLLTVLDNFELAETALSPKTEGEEAIIKSYKALNKQLLDVLVKLNVEPVEAVGEEFDPNFMEAITQQPSDEYEEGKVAAQMKRGYKLGELVVRPAMVVVSMGKQ